MNLIIKAEPLPGTRIEDAVQDAIRLAKKMDCPVELSFNGHTFLYDALSDADAEILGYKNRYANLGELKP